MTPSMPDPTDWADGNQDVRQREHNMKRTVIVGAFLLGLVCPWAAFAERPNVLLLLVDDLKPTLGCYVTRRRRRRRSTHWQAGVVIHLRIAERQRPELLEHSQVR